MQMGKSFLPSFLGVEQAVEGVRELAEGEVRGKRMDS
jgi:hypothetical protein